MINWTEPFGVAKERAKVMKLPLLWIVLISLFSGVFSGVSFYAIASLTNNSLHVDMLFFIGLLVAGSVVYTMSKTDIVQQSISIDNLDKAIRVVGTDSRPHIIQFSALKGYAINTSNMGMFLCLYSADGGTYSVALPRESSNVEAAINESLSGIKQVNFINDLTRSRDT
ncbi:hypothetical protein [Vibrio parahaemolyticus]|uniref:hypothetical protein n=1 Tax=Vibrio parahaemolyticus TaxID=670 RepID=UPI001120B3E8|nr:hypothetical protein [Vibrio parahaemolyticus]TOH92693.1 hypothetical protein CGI71_02430 [Vibrio parahaemolyticus]TOK98405.1 hypothetical protein CGI09_25300 [Vibrio parahaemolyticus]TOP85466.1 hypothetical protein CGH08_15810 [Vibrio parahaemolyticus]TOQ28418.1 hypothetical protein CGG99_15230 [Vibrio parahaemolyticus]HCG5312481.1 hypothetical protein [Vibrio parahaemolyticus]